MLQYKINSLFKENRLSDWLPYHAYDEENQLYTNADGTYGFILECAPIMFAGEQLLSGLTSVLQQEWPKDSLIQFILYADPNMTGIIDRYCRIRDRLLDVSNPREEFLHTWTRWQADYLRKHRHQGISRDVPVPFRNFRAFITAKIPCSRSDLLGRSTKTLEQIRILRDSLTGTLRSNAIRSQDCHPSILIQWLWQVWNPGHPFLESNIYDERRVIKEQIIAPDTEITRTARTLVVDGYPMSVRIPQVYSQEPRSFQVNQLVGDLLGSNLQQLCSPFLLSLNVDPCPVDKELNVKAEVSGIQKSAFKALSPKTERKREEFAWAAEEREKGVKFVRGYLTLVMYDNVPVLPGQTYDSSISALARNESMVNTVWGNQGFRLQSEVFCGLEFMMAAMPFGLYRSSLKNMNRLITAPAAAFSCLAPLQADWRGTLKEGMLFITRRGQLCCLDFFDSDTNYNFAVAAPSGSGKSFLVNKILQEYASQRGECYIVDVGKSYKKQCQLQMGQYVEFDESKDISVNIFGELSLEAFRVDELEQEAEHGMPSDQAVQLKKDRTSLLTLYTQLLGVMANPKEPITDLENALLSNCIIEAYSRLKPGDIMIPDNFVAVLDEWQRENDERGKQEFVAGQLATRLRKYCRGGEHGRWFRGRMNVSFEKLFVVLELEQLNAMKDLREVILLLIISIIERKFYFGNRSVPKIMLFDEAWDLFRNPNTAAFIETAYRRFRKYNGSIGTIVQSFLDFANRGNEQVGQAILSNSEWKLLLQPKIEELKECVDRNLLSINEAGLQIAQTVRTTKGLYSEVLLLSSNQCSVFRFVPTPAEKTAFTTLPHEVQVYENIYSKLLEEGTEPEPLTLLSLSCHANALMEQGYSAEDAERLTLLNRDDAIAYADSQFKVA